MLLYMQKETQYKTEPLPYRKQGVVGRVSYAYDGRYFIEGNFGYRFGSLRQESPVRFLPSCRSCLLSIQ